MSDITEGTIIPAYGRKTNSKDAAINDFKDGKDFVLKNFRSRWDNKPMSIRDCKVGDRVQIRYANLRRVCFYTVDGTEPGRKASNG